ncbi:hypothetical protein HOF65_02300 [bacterium]|nr:hypothetical protein [bacterium]MBT3852831.1 hypothetical protein [bacterium]MBT4632574.1 hypothetical protein [bacterium]MBT5492513.1 hypothetical protein [bacterium]MBT6779188.1 hypothetical protein [bacterium]
MVVVFVVEKNIKTYHNIDNDIKKNNKNVVTLDIFLLKFLNLYACILATINNPHNNANTNVYTPKYIANITKIYKN